MSEILHIIMRQSFICNIREYTNCLKIYDQRAIQNRNRACGSSDPEDAFATTRAVREFAKRAWKLEGGEGAARDGKPKEIFARGERGGENYQALVDGCLWRALQDQECIRGDAQGGERASE